MGVRRQCTLWAPVAALHAATCPFDRPLPRAVLDELSSLSCQPRRLPVIADGRCSVASVLLACRMIDDAHINEQGRQTIDAERRRLGRSMMDRWTEADWIRRVPMHIRGAYTTYDETDPAGTRRHSSHKALHQLLTEKAPTGWLDHAVFYLAKCRVRDWSIHHPHSGQRQVVLRADR